MSIEKPPISMIGVQLRSFVETLRSSDEEIRKQLDVGYSWDGQTALLFEIRPQWNDSTKQPESTNLQELLTEIQNDAYGCFFG